MTKDEFDAMIENALQDLPQEFLDQLDNVEITSQAWPSREQLASVGVSPGSLLFGLYQGVPKTKRGKGSMYPDKITIFAGPILAVSRDEQDMRERVARTVRHEIAHHFGMDEHAIRKAGH